MTAPAAPAAPDAPPETAPILIFPNPKLRDPCQPAVGAGIDLWQLSARLRASMAAANGLGLAAPQIGVALRMFVLDVHADPEARTFLDPVIVWLSDDQATIDEGCLSFPEVFFPIRRPARVKMRAVGLDGVAFEVDAEGLFARALQHEYDHTVGRLMIDAVGPVKRDIIRRKMRAWTRRERDT